MNLNQAIIVLGETYLKLRIEQDRTETLQNELDDTRRQFEEFKAKQPSESTELKET